MCRYRTSRSSTINNCSSAIEKNIYSDLAVFEFNTDPIAILSNSITLSAKIKNIGDNKSSSTNLRYYRSSDNIIDSHDTLLATSSIPILLANNNIAVSTEIALSFGTHFYGVCIDTVPYESSTINNCSSATTIPTF